MNYTENEAGKFIEVTIDGEISKEEMEAMWEKLNARIDQWGQVGVLKEVKSFPKVELAALLTNIQNGIKNYSRFNRAAVVTDEKWIKEASEIFAKFSDIKTAVFSSNQKEEARQWLAEHA